MFGFGRQSFVGGGFWSAVAGRRKIYITRRCWCATGVLRRWQKKTACLIFRCFDERRYFTAGGEKPLIFSVNDNVYALQICQDMWDRRQAQDVRMAAAKHTLCLNASPFSVGKHARRLQAAGEFARRSIPPFIIVIWSAVRMN